MVTYAPEINAIFDQMEVPLTVLETPEKGKHVIATKDLPKGTELFEEIPLVSWPLDTFQELGVGQCWWCLKLLPAAEGASSSGPVEVRRQWCSDACCASAKVAVAILTEAAESALHEFHVQERGRLNTSLPISAASVARCVASIGARMVTIMEQQHLTADLLCDADIKRQVFGAATKFFNRLVEPPQNSEFKDISVDAWVNVLQHELRQPLTRTLLHPLVSSASGGSASAVQVVRELVDAILSHDTINTIIGQLSINSQALNVVANLPREGPAVVCMGGGLFTLQSNFNHSCAPNAMVSASPERNHEIVLIANKPIAKGEEVTISYIVTEGKSVTERRDELQSYFFTCECPRCKSEKHGEPGEKQ
jgi:hypothetical protein